MRQRDFWTVGIALLAAAILLGCRSEKQAGDSRASNYRSESNYLTLASGTSIDVTLGTALSSETAVAGSSWSGTVLNGREGIPAGSSVAGTITSVKAAQKGGRAMLDLGLTSFTVDGHRYAVHATTEAIIAGSTRARNLGAIAGSAAGGALIGRAVSGSNRGTLIGAVVGAGVATGVVAASDGYQVVLKPGTALTFMTDEAVAVRP
jgi:hypothetical protein